MKGIYVNRNATKHLHHMLHFRRHQEEEVSIPACLPHDVNRNDADPVSEDEEEEDNKSGGEREEERGEKTEHRSGDDEDEARERKWVTR
uniref:Uncharacterized protein n=1 Tax=Noccaea caerulescens TaxID=107243 RepID=A0A1J3JA50_NOCCA